MTGEYEPEDSRNITGTAATPDGRWTAQGVNPPLANGQEPGRVDPALAGQIKSHMMVIDSEGRQVGTVDHVDGDRIKLTRAESPDGEHRYLPLSAVASVEADAVRLAEGNRAMLSGGGD